MMRVCIDAKSLMPPRAGVARYVEGLLAGLASVSHPDVEISALSPAKPRRTFVWVAWDLQWATAGRYDLFHFPFYYMPLAPRCATVLAIHDVLILEHPEWFHRSWSSPIRMLMPRSARRADAVVTSSECVAASIRDRCRVPGDRIHVIPYGVDPGRFSPATPEALSAARRAFRLERPFVLQLGAIEIRRGVDLALRATEELRREFRDLELVLAGPVRSHLPELNSPPSWVRRLGYVEDDALPALMGGAAAVLAPSRGEGFDLPVLEALACGAAVVASDIPPHLEHFRSNVAVFESGSAESCAAALQHVLADSGLAASLRSAGPQLAAGFTWEDAARRHLDLWQQLR